MTAVVAGDANTPIQKGFAMPTTVPTLVIMGVAGCGKSRVGMAVAAASRRRFVEGDHFHPPKNVDKMRSGAPLDDNDRADWLRRLADELTRGAVAGEQLVLSCSALKKRYRDSLRQAAPGVGFVYLEISPEEARRRVASRPSHYMPANLVDSQFAALEPPFGECGVVTIDAGRPVEEIVREIVDRVACRDDTPTGEAERG